MSPPSCPRRLESERQSQQPRKNASRRIWLTLNKRKSAEKLWLGGRESHARSHGQEFHHDRTEVDKAIKRANGVCVLLDLFMIRKQIRKMIDEPGAARRSPSLVRVHCLFWTTIAFSLAMNPVSPIVLCSFVNMSLLLSSPGLQSQMEENLVIRNFREPVGKSQHINCRCSAGLSAASGQFATKWHWRDAQVFMLSDRHTNL